MLGGAQNNPPFLQTSSRLSIHSYGAPGTTDAAKISCDAIATDLRSHQASGRCRERRVERRVPYCGGMEDDDEKLIQGPVQNRRCTDAPCAIVFLAYLAGFGYLCYGLHNYSDPHEVLGAPIGSMRGVFLRC